VYSVTVIHTHTYIYKDIVQCTYLHPNSYDFLNLYMIPVSLGENCDAYCLKEHAVLFS